jgi:hypothetical protein
LLQFHKWLAAWAVKAVRRKDENEKSRLDAQLEAHACWRELEDAKEKKAGVSEKARGKWANRSDKQKARGRRPQTRRSRRGGSGRARPACRIRRRP